MKKITALLAVFAIFAMMFIGCDSTEDIDAPGGLTLGATTVGDDLTLTWTESSTEDIDGYKIIFNDVEIATNINSNTYTHTDVTETGTYEVIAYKGDDESDPATASSEAYEATSQAIYNLNSTDGPSAIGFNYDTGMMSHFSAMHDYVSDIDFILDGDYWLISPDTDPVSWADGKTNYLKVKDTPVPPAEMSAWGSVSDLSAVNNEAWIAVNNFTNFGLVKVNTYDATGGNIVVTYKFQTIDNFIVVE